uniref:Leucine-rich repeat-containing N-terminal plant-type domain-containing protein n=1 Tax=Oryza brachyantha TaxID=4533 RepID=J3MIZ2_ORYBR
MRQLENFSSELNALLAPDIPPMSNQVIICIWRRHDDDDDLAGGAGGAPGGGDGGDGGGVPAGGEADGGEQPAAAEGGRDEPCAVTVAGLDLNHGDLAGEFPEELGLLSDLAVLHLNSNRFCGTLPESLPKLSLLHELDVSNNRLSGGFPQHILCLPNVKYVDIRFNNFCGAVPPAIFDKKIDALFLNDNHFDFELPDNFGNSPASVIVLANVNLRGCIPSSIGRMGATLNELIVLNSGVRSCIPPEVGHLGGLTVLDLSFNQLQGALPESMAWMRSLEQLDVAHNELAAYNSFCGDPERCLGLRRVDDRQNCIAGRPDQRPADQCLAFLHRPPVHCDAHGCFAPPGHY